MSRRPMDRPNLVEAVRRGAWPVFACQVASQVISLLVLAVLYRLISPDEFGYFAAILVGVNLGRLVAGWGLSTAAVQDANLTETAQSHLYRTGVRIAAVLMLVFAAVAAMAPTATAKVAINILGLSLLVSAFGAQHQARLERKLQFAKLAYCRLTAQVCGGAAGIGLAWFDYGLVALATQQLVEIATLAALLWSVESWRPSCPVQQPQSGHLFRFGTWYTLSGLMFWIAQNIDTILIAVLGGPHALGLYSQAYNLVMKPVLLVTTPLTGLMLPALSRAVPQPLEYRRLLVGFYRFVGLLLLPCSVGLFVVADDLMLLLGGDQWKDAGAILRGLAPVVAVQGFINISGSVFASAGRADRLFAGATAIALLLAQGIAAGWWLGTLFRTSELGGTLGVAWGYSLVTVAVIFVPYLWFCLTTVGVSLREVLGAIARSAAMSLVMGIAVWGISGSLFGAAPMVRLATCVVSGALIYLALMWRDVKTLFGNRGKSFPKSVSSES